MKFVNLLLISVLVSGCTSTSEVYPDIELSSLHPSVVVALPVSGRYMKHFDACLDPDAICMDPPPMLIRYRVLENVYGKGLPNNLNIKTTSHFGLVSYNFKDPYPQLLLVGTNGVENIMPRYHRMQVAQDNRGKFVIPIYEDADVWWLPCEVRSLIRKVNFDTTYRRLNLPIEDYLPELEDSGYNLITKNSIKPLSGIYVQDLESFLSQRNIIDNIESFNCDER